MHDTLWVDGDAADAGEIHRYRRRLYMGRAFREGDVAKKSKRARSRERRGSPGGNSMCAVVSLSLSMTRYIYILFGTFGNTRLVKGEMGQKGRAPSCKTGWLVNYYEEVFIRKQ